MIKPQKLHRLLCMNQCCNSAFSVRRLKSTRHSLTYVFITAMQCKMSFSLSRRPENNVSCYEFWSVTFNRFVAEIDAQIQQTIHCWLRVDHFFLFLSFYNHLFIYYSFAFDSRNLLFESHHSILCS